MKVINCNKILETNTAGTFIEVPNDRGDILIVDISGGFSNISLQIFGRICDEAEYTPVLIFGDKDLSKLESNEIIETGCYQVPIYGYSDVKISVDSISGGVASVFAKIIQEV